MNVVIDIETTGLIKGVHEIIELYVGIYNEKFKITDTFHSFINPTREDLFTSEAKKINKISIEKLKASPTPGEVRGDFIEWHEDICLGEVMVPLGHVYPFDAGFLELFLGKFYNEIFDYHYKDTSVISNFLMDAGLIEQGSSSLVRLTEIYNIPHKAHSAEGDALATLQLYKKLIELL
jgi:DNA polymerase-3 subunit alpha (Gram-positive type)